MFFKELQMDEEIKLIIDLFIKDNNREPVDWYIEDHKLIIYNENNEVLIRFNDCINEIDFINEDGIIEKNIDLAVVRFSHKRQGYCTKLIELLYGYGSRNGYSNIILEAVFTKEMRNFARKKGFEKFDGMNWKKKIIV